MIDRELLDILACPECKAEVVLEEDAPALRCTACGRLFPIQDGIPDMFVDP